MQYILVSQCILQLNEKNYMKYIKFILHIRDQIIVCGEEANTGISWILKETLESP